MHHTTENTFRASSVQEVFAQSSARILMAEDNMVNQKLANLLFRKLNFQVDMVSNGKQAVEAAIKGLYDLVFMDIQMPILSGVEASRQIKMALGEDAPTIVALTANAMQGDREKYLEAGMDHYLAKPISMQDLSRFIERYVNV